MYERYENLATSLTILFFIAGTELKLLHTLYQEKQLPYLFT